MGITFCAGERGSPGGPIAIAILVKIVADDLQLMGVNAGMGTAEKEARDAAEAADPTDPAPPAAKKAKPVAKKGRGRHAFAAAAQNAAQKAAEAQGDDAPELQRVPSAMERRAPQDQLKIIQDLYGSRAQTLIDMLLAFDAYTSIGTTPSRNPSPFFAIMSSG